MATSGTNVKDNNQRRGRMRYTAEQLKRLEAAFSEEHYPEAKTQEQLAADLGVTVERVHIWYQNRRSKFKRESKTDHVMWMRKQIFKTDDKKGSPPLPFGTPRLPALTTSCHVLSPPDTTQYGRQDTAWERPVVNLDSQQSRSTDFNPVLDLRTCVSPDSRPSPTPENTHINNLQRPTPVTDACFHSNTPATESRFHSNTFSDVSPSPCRYSTPSPVPTPPAAHRTLLPPAHIHGFPRNMLSPVGYRSEVSSFHVNKSSNYDDRSFSSPTNIYGFYGNLNEPIYSINQFPWYSPHILPVSMTTSELSSAARQCAKTVDGLFFAQGDHVIHSNSSAGSKRKRNSELWEPSFEETESIKRQKLWNLPETVSEVCSEEVGEPNDLDLVQEQGNNSDSSLHVDLEQWC